MASTTKKHKKPSNGSNGAAEKPMGGQKNGRPNPLGAGISDPQVEVSAVDFQQWTAYLSSRKTPVPARKLFSNISTAPLSWGLPADLSTSSHVLDLIRGTNKLKRTSKFTTDSVWQDWLVSWLAERNSQAGVTDALECLVWAYAAPQMASRIEAGTWRELMTQLLKTIQDAEVGLEQTCGWTRMLVSGELPLVLAYQFPELPECRQLAKPAAKFVSQCSEQWLDGGGLPHANHIVSIRPLLATFTRSLRLAKETVNAKISKSALSEFNWLVQQALRLTRCDFSSVMTAVDQACPKETFFDLFNAALSLSNDKWDAALLQAVLNAHAPKTHKAPRDRDLPDDPSYQSDWSECAVLQTDWSPKTPRLTITHADRQMIGELSVGKEIVFAGNLQPSITINGKDAPITKDWECVCWFSDDDVDMLELRTDLTGGWTLERQVLMARDDQFLLMADVLSGHRKAQLEYASTLPLWGGCTFKPDKETRDGFLIGKHRLGLVLPLALPEWRTDPRGGTLAESNNGLELRQSAEACSLYAPLFMDLHPRRMRAIPTWRSLTVAENLNISTRDEAIGYRVQVGVEQWLFYRSIRPTISRTILGQHLSCEFVFGRFLNDGTIESIVEIANDDPRSSE